MSQFLPVTQVRVHGRLTSLMGRVLKLWTQDPRTLSEQSGSC